MKIGDRVTCIRSHSSFTGSKKGRDYIIYSEDICACGLRSFDIGIENGPEIHGSVCVCGNFHFTSIFWHDEILFRKVEEKVNYVKLEVAIEEPILN